MIHSVDLHCQQRHTHTLRRRPPHATVSTHQLCQRCTPGGRCLQMLCRVLCSQHSRVEVPQAWHNSSRCDAHTRVTEFSQQWVRCLSRSCCGSLHVAIATTAVAGCKDGCCAEKGSQGATDTPAGGSCWLVHALHTRSRRLGLVVQQ